jgi:hypothetical protein
MTSGPYPSRTHAKEVAAYRRNHVGVSSKREIEASPCARAGVGNFPQA